MQVGSSLDSHLHCPDRTERDSRPEVQTAPLHVAIVDSAIAHAESLIAGVRKNVCVFTLDPGRDSVTSLSEILNGLHEKVASLHLVSHGSPGCLRFGTSRIDRQTLARDRNVLARWADIFAQDARVYVYGCRVASGVPGSAFVESLSQLWGVTVSASSTLVGCDMRGGNWHLDVSTGARSLAAPVLAFRSEVLAAYPDTLADVTYQAEDAIYDGPVFRTGDNSTGSGYIDFVFRSNQFVEWTIDAPLAGDYYLTFRYANADSNNRPMRLDINGVVEDSRVDFADTGDWDDWNALELRVPLRAGSNTVRLTTLGNLGPNFDYVNVREFVPGEIRYESEDAILNGPLIRTGRASSGTGFIDFQNQPGQYVEWTVEVPSAGTYDLAFRYAYGRSGSILMDVSVNGTVAIANLDFAGTGRWLDWGFLNTSLPLQAGTNTIRVSAVGNEGPNFDHLTLFPLNLPTPTLAISDASATEGTDDFLVFNLSLSDPSTETITLDLSATDGAAKGGAIADFSLDPTGDPIDYANAEFEVSADGGITWQAATNGTEVTFAPGQTELDVRLAINDDAADEGDATETLTLSVETVISGAVETSDTGTGAIADNDITLAATRYEAEDAVFDGPVLQTGGDSSGTGYIDFTFGPNQFVEWTIDAPIAGVYDLTFRYASADPSNRPMRLSVNGNVEIASLDFPTTGGWIDWEFATAQVSLPAGTNTLRLTTVGNLGPNYDYLTVTPPSPTLAIADASATEGVDGFLLFNLSLSAASPEIITLDLSATDGTAQGGAIADFGLDPAGNPVDYANAEFEVSADGGITWQAAVNGTEVTFAPGQTELDVRLAVNDDAADEGDTAETLTLNVDTILTGLVDASDAGAGAIADNDAPPTQTLYQAEDANFVGPIVISGGGATGTGYLDFQNATGDFIEWTVEVPTAGAYDLTWRYVNGKANRPLSLSVNGTVDTLSLDFETTGTWSNWTLRTQVVTLNAGTNQIRLEAIGSSGANFDYLEVTPFQPVVSISDATATEGLDDYLIFNLSLNAPSLEAIALDLSTTEDSVKGGAIADFGLDLAGDPVDFANAEFEVSTDGGITWQAAINGTEVTFAPGQTELDVRLAINDDLADEGGIPETFEIGVETVLAGSVAALDTGEGSIFDDDNTVGPSTIYQAEDATFVGPVFTPGGGATGTGYLDFTNPTSDFIEWTVSVPTAGVHDLTWRYVNGEFNRPLSLIVNGQVETPGLDFLNTGSWSDWGFLSYGVALDAGTNQIRLEATGSSGANFDYLQVAPSQNVLTIADATATEGTDDYLVFNLSLAAPSQETLTLDLSATDGSAKGGAIADFGLDPTGDPLDYANAEFEVSADGGSTWQAATNGTEVTFTPGQTELDVRLAVNDDAADEAGTAETLTLGVATVLVGSVEADDTGEGTIFDNDSDSEPSSIIYQAEDANFVGPVFAPGGGATGTGYLDFTNSTTDYIEWTVIVPTAGAYDLSWRYVNGEFNRPMSLSINGEVENSALDFINTGGWLDWGLRSYEVALEAGTNLIRLEAIGNSGGNFDYLEVGSGDNIVSISDASATEGIEDFLTFNLTLTAPSSNNITLDLSATDGSATGGAIADFGIDPDGDPIDYANEEFDVSSDGGLTWNAATNGTQVTFAAGQTELDVRLAVHDDAADEGGTAETLTLGVGSVLAGSVAAVDFGEGLIFDDDNGSGPVATIYQAEDAEFLGPLLIPGGGATGTGYLDFQNPTTDYIEWTIAVPTAGAYDLTWRYVNGKANRPLSLAINGVVDTPSLDFPTTGEWTDWDLRTQTVTLDAGLNQIRLEAVGSSGANFDYLQVVPFENAISISDATATEGTDEYLIFDLSLLAPSTGPLSLVLETTDITALGGAIADFSLGGNPVDYANAEFDVSSDGGITWQPTGTVVTFAPGESDLQVRLAINDDEADEGLSAETILLGVASILSGATLGIADIGIGTIIDNDREIGSGYAPLSLLPAGDIRVEGDRTFSFDGNDGGLVDGDNTGLGFTMVDPSTNASNPDPLEGVVGYFPDNLNVTNGVLEVTTTAGLNFGADNAQDNALGVGLNLPSKAIRLETTLVDLPEPVGGSAIAGLWLGKADGGGAGSSEDDYIRFGVQSNLEGNYRLKLIMEQDGLTTFDLNLDIPDNPDSVELSLFADPNSQTVTAAYSLNGDDLQTLPSINSVPDEWFSFDQAGIDPTLGTRSFGGILASHRDVGSSQVFSFEAFSVTEEEPPPPPAGQLDFDRWSIPVDFATALEYGPDGRLYVATLFGTIYAYDIDWGTRTVQEEVINTVTTSEGGPRLTLGLAIDPDSTADDVVLWVSHSDGSIDNGALNSGKISRLSGTGLTQIDDIVTGLPRAIANHATNDIDFGPDGRLYAWQGGNTGAGSANTADTEFFDRPEQVLSAAALAIDIPKWKADPSSFNGDVASPIGEFVDEFYDRKATELGRPYDDVEIFASGLRNTYDGVFHSNGNIYAPDNGLGVTGTVTPVPRLGDPSDRSITTQFGDVNFDDPGKQNDPLNLIVEGGYYGHPNPYRDEVVFKDGTFQGFDATNIPVGHPDYTEPFLDLGTNRSNNGIIEYTADNFFGQLQGDLLLASFSQGDDITRIQLSEDGLSVVESSQFVSGLNEPLPLLMGPDGAFFLGEFNGSVTVFEPLGTWRADLPVAPEAILDAGSASLDGKLYAIGGKTDTTYLNTTYIYDPGDPFDETDDIWTSAADLPGEAVENPAVVEYGSEIYVFGGSTAPFSGAVSNSAVFDPMTGTWTSLAQMPTARGGASATVIDDKIYVLGGLDASGSSIATVEIFDPISGTWSAGTEMLTRRDNLGTAAIDNQLYAFGGRTRNEDGSILNNTLDTLEIYDPTSDQWVFGASMPTGRRAFSVGTLEDRIQVIGGEQVSGESSFSANEEYDPLTDSWRTLPAIATPRHGAVFGTIDNVIYVAGGGPTGGTSFTDVVEAFTF